jgi:hypothetical protein
LVGQDVHRFAPTILDVALTEHTVTLYASTPDQTGVDDVVRHGATWHPVRAG